MKKIAIILDSFCGKNKEQVEKNEDYFFISLKAIVDGKTIRDGIDMSSEKLMQTLNKAVDIKTSQPSPADFMKVFKKTSQEYENTFYFPTPTALSGTAQTAKMVAKDYKNIHIISGFAVGRAYLEIAKYVAAKARAEVDIKKLIKFAKKFVCDKSTFVIPKNIKALLRSGRMGKNLSKIFEKMNIIPVVELRDEEKLKKKQIKRSGKKAADYGIDELIKNLGDEKDNYIVQITHTLDKEIANYAEKKLKERGFDVHVESTSGIICANVGDGAFSLGSFKKIN